MQFGWKERWFDVSRPSGTCVLSGFFPPLKRWAGLSRPSGTKIRKGWCVVAITAIDVVLANGRDAEDTAPGGATAGDVAFTLGSSSGFDVGAPVFCSEGGDTEFEFLGDVVGVDGNEITTSLALLANKSAGAKFWTPVSSAVILPVSGRVMVETDRGMAFTRTGDGFSHSYKIRDTRRFPTLAYPKIEVADWRLLLAFWESATGANEGLSDFVLATWDFEFDERVVWTVRAVSDLPEFDSRRRGLTSLAVELQKVNEAYA